MSSWLMALFNFSLSFLIFCLVLSIIESGVLKPLIVIVQCLFHFYFFLHNFCALLLQVYKCYIFFCSIVTRYKCYIFFMGSPFIIIKCVITSNSFLFVLNSNISIATPAFLWLLFAWYIFFQTFTFKLFVSLNLKKTYS